jgi:hypothetical protein
MVTLLFSRHSAGIRQPFNEPKGSWEFLTGYGSPDPGQVAGTTPRPATAETVRIRQQAGMR